MNATLGFGFVVLGLAASVLGAAGGIYGLVTGNTRVMATVRQWAWLVVLASVGGFLVMQVALFQRDYSVEYVSRVGSETTPFLFNVAALWSSLEGSILLWALVLGGYLAAVMLKFRNRKRDPLYGWAVVTMLGVTTFFFALMAGPANPFTTVDVPPGFTGPGPNPLLQNHILMAFHPPMLYLGYVGFTVPFAFAVAALVTGRLGEGWLLETRRWTVAAWGFLTLGIILGAWWSYEVLGWGGYWGWDPVENASLLPWLTGTAYLHSVIVQERRGMLRVWNLSLLCATFCLTILGTFLTRSGVVDSVHAFTAGAVGPWLLTFFGIVTALSVGLIAWRGDALRSPGAIDHPVSREGAFLVNNLLFGAMAFVVLLGTVFPLVAEAWDGSRLTIGDPYFNAMNRPIGLALLFLMAVAPLLPWRTTSTELLSARLFWPALTGVGIMLVALVVGARGVWALASLGLAGFAGAAALRQIVLACRRQGWRGLVGRSNGGMVVHLGVVLLAFGLTASETYRSERTFLMEVGETVTFEGHELTYLEPGADINDRRLRTYALIGIDGGQAYAPAITNYRLVGTVVPTPSVRTRPHEDIFLALDQLPNRGDDSIRLRVIVRPLVVWLWIGGGVMALGSLLALIPTGRRPRIDLAAAGRVPVDDTPAAAGAESGAGGVAADAGGDRPVAGQGSGGDTREREFVGD